MKKKYLLLVLASCTLLLTGCQEIPKLEDGKEVVAKIEGVDVTAEQLYEELKGNIGISVLIDMIDSEISNIEIEDQTEAQQYALNNLESIKFSYEQSGQDFAQALIDSGFASEDDYVEYVKNDYLKTLTVEKFLKENLSDDEINDYYNDEVYGDLSVRHILIAPEVTDDMTTEQIATAEANALTEANNLIAQLNEGADFSELAKVNSDDTGSKETGGVIADFTKGDMVTEFWDASLALEIGEYTTTAVKSEFGYHIIIKDSHEEKPALEDIKNEVMDLIVEEKMSETSIYEKTWDEIRKSYGFEIYDSVLNNNYDSIISNIE